MTISTEGIWRDFSARLRAFIRREVPDEHLASDVLQEVFVRIHNGVASLNDEDRLVSWIYRVARNTIADHFRRSRRDHALSAIQPPGREPEEDSVSNYNEEVSQWLRTMVSSLPKRYQEAVTLAELEGQSQREVGERLGLSLSGAKSRVQRGRDHLRRRLLDCCHLEFDRRGNVMGYQRRGDCSGCCS